MGATAKLGGSPIKEYDYPLAEQVRERIKPVLPKVGAHKVYCYDVNSLFPTQPLPVQDRESEMKMPVGDPTYFKMAPGVDF